MKPVVSLEQIENIELQLKAASFEKKVIEWYQKNKRSLPWRELFKKYKSPYHVWVSEIMLQQTVIKAVIPKYISFFERFPTVFDLAAAEEDDVRIACQGLGYYRRFKLMHNCAKKLCEDQTKDNFKWPSSYKEWIKYPGIGTYTASAISSICLSEAQMVVDGNVERLMCRLHDIRLEPNLPPLKKKFTLWGKELISDKAPGDFNQGLMELGQTICTKANPSCSLCPVENPCLSQKRKSQDLAPAVKKKANFEKVQLAIVLEENKKGILVKRRSIEAKFLKDYVGFPTYLAEDKKLKEDGGKAVIDATKLTKLGSFKHSITKHKITADVYLKKSSSKKAENYLSKDSISTKLTASLDLKALKLLERYEKSL